LIGRSMRRDRHQEFIRFLNPVEREVPVGRTVHAILDKYSAYNYVRGDDIVSDIGQSEIDRPEHQVDISATAVMFIGAAASSYRHR